MTKHMGFMLEAFVEAFPQSILQMIAIVKFKEANIVSIISILISMISVATKSMVINIAKDFEQQDLLPTASLNQPFFAQNKNDLNVSWGNYFAHKSPPMGQLSGSHGIASNERPQFNQEHNKKGDEKEAELDDEERMKISDLDEVKEEAVDNKERTTDELAVGILDDIDELEDGDMVRINVEDMNKSMQSMNSINFGEFTDHYLSNRDSNSTQKTTSSTDSQKISKLIQIPRLKYIQRFCQFAIGNKLVNEREDEIEAKVEEIIERYIAEIGDEETTEKKEGNMHLAAVTYTKDTNMCTALLMFDNKCNENADEWIDHFLAYPDMVQLVDKEAETIFTQLSSN